MLESCIGVPCTHGGSENDNLINIGYESMREGFLMIIQWVEVVYRSHANL